MGDIVERLRQRANILAEAEDDALYAEAKQLREAADEIERLRKINTKLRHDLSNRIDEIFGYDTEIERLRNAKKGKSK